MTTLTQVKRYVCFWCDRSTKDQTKVKIDGLTGKLICHDCLPDVRAARIKARKAEGGNAW
jgi:hypothetical protein